MSAVSPAVADLSTTAAACIDFTLRLSAFFLLSFCIDPRVGLLRVLPGAVGWGPARGHVPPPHCDQFGSIVCCRRSRRGPGKDHKRVRVLPGKPGCAAYPSDYERAGSSLALVFLRLALAYRLEWGCSCCVEVKISKDITHVNSN